MLRLVLALLYLIASSSSPAPHSKQGGSADPLGLNFAPPQTEGGGGIDPLGLNSPPSNTDQGGSADPLG